MAAIDWLYILEHDFEFDLSPYLSEGLRGGYEFRDAEGRPRLRIDVDGKARILASYAWDGCTPKFAVLDVAFGVPDGVPHHGTKKPKAYYASLVHDVLYQFLDEFEEHGVPITRALADRVFHDFLARDEFALRPVYYRAVRWFGWFFRGITKRKRQYVTSMVELADRETALASGSGASPSDAARLDEAS